MQKQCTKCHQIKLLVEFHRFKHSADGHKSRCKPCNSADSVKWQQTNKDKYLARYKNWAINNRDKTRSASLNWNRRNPGVNYQRRVANVGREAINQKSRNWAAFNKNKVRKWKANWKKNNPSAVAAMTGKRRAALRNAIPLWANAENISKIYFMCREKPNYHVDHIVPLVSTLVCGLHCEANLQIIPAAENYSKNNRKWPDMP